MMKIACRCLLLFLLAASAYAQSPSSPFRFRDVDPTSLELSDNGKPVFVYNHGMRLPSGVPEDRRRSSYFHPVYAPDGTVVTDDFPRDHYHHRGIFWAWPIVRVDGEGYDQWLIRGIRQQFVRWIDKKTDARSATLSVENGWFAGERKLLKETITVVAKPVQGNSRDLEFRLVLEALDKPVEIEGTSEGKKGYGGFSVRFAAREQTVVTTDTGRETRDTDMVPHPWAQLQGQFGGKPATLRVAIDPANPGAPNGWCLRNYGFLGVNFPGMKPFRIEPGKPLSLKYVVTVSAQ